MTLTAIAVRSEARPAMGLSNDGVNLDRSHIGTGSPIEFVVLGLLRLSLASSPSSIRGSVGET